MKLLKNLSLLLLLSTMLFANYPQWDNNTNYTKGDIVSYKGGVWTAQRKVFKNTPPLKDDNGWFWQKSSVVRNSLVAEWHDNKNYFKGDIVTHKGVSWQAQRKVFKNTPPKNTDDGWFWKQYSAMRGGVASDWNSNKNYFKGDVVTYKGRSWTAQRKVFKNTPPKDTDGGWFWKAVGEESKTDTTK